MWTSSVNRDPLRDRTNHMGKHGPLVIEILLDHPEALQGDAVCPVVESGKQ